MRHSLILRMALLLVVLSAGRLFGAEAGTEPTKTLYQAASDGDLSELKLLLARGADVNKADEYGKTALGCAVRSNQADAVRLLIEAKANVNANGMRGSTPLVTAAARGNAEIITALLAAGADANLAEQMGQTPLLAAVDIGNLEAVKLLVEKGADVSAANTGGETPLSVATRGRRTDIADYLTQHGAVAPVLDSRLTGPYGAAGQSEQVLPGPAAVPLRRGRGGAIEIEAIKDPNAIKAKVASFAGLAASLAAVDANSASLQRAWEQRRSDNRTSLLRSVAKQFDDELHLVKTVAVAEKADKTVKAVDDLAAARTKRYAAVGEELRQQRREAATAARAERTRGRSTATSRTGRGRSARGQTVTEPAATEGVAGPYGAEASGRPRRPAREEPNEPILDAQTQSDIQEWMKADPDKKEGLLDTSHLVDLAELEAVRLIAVEEEAAKTTATIEGLMVTLQDRVKAIKEKMLAAEERQRRYEERYGDPATAGRGRGSRTGRGATQQDAQSTQGRRYR